MYSQVHNGKLHFSFLKKCSPLSPHITDILLPICSLWSICIQFDWLQEPGLGLAPHNGSEQCQWWLILPVILGQILLPEKPLGRMVELQLLTFAFPALLALGDCLARRKGKHYARLDLSCYLVCWSVPLWISSKKLSNVVWFYFKYCQILLSNITLEYYILISHSPLL